VLICRSTSACRSPSDTSSVRTQTIDQSAPPQLGQSALTCGALRLAATLGLAVARIRIAGGNLAVHSLQVLLRASCTRRCQRWPPAKPPARSRAPASRPSSIVTNALDYHQCTVPHA
jgi:hypothetical protein